MKVKHYIKTETSKRYVGTDKTSRLMKISRALRSEPSADEMNNSLSKTVFVEVAKVASVSPGD